MNKTICLTLCLLGGVNLYAGEKKSLADINSELKVTKSTSDAVVLLADMSSAVPETEKDMAALGEIMDKYSPLGQRLIVKIKDPKLAPALRKECDRQAGKFKAARGKGDANLTPADRQEYLNSYLNSAAAIDALSKLQDKEAVPQLRGYLQDPDLSVFASIALGRLGDDGSLDNMMGNMGHGNKVDLSGYGDKGLVRVVEELDKPITDSKRKDALIDQIKGSSSPERKRLLKDLALNHKDARVRDRCGQALLNSIMVNPESGDSEFINNWVKKTKNENDGDWAVMSIRVSRGNGTLPIDQSTIATLIDVLLTSTQFSSRNEAASILGIYKIKESLPYLEECIAKDKQYGVRVACREAYLKTAGRLPPIFNNEDAAETNKLVKDSDFDKTTAEFSSKDPIRKYREALKSAFQEYEKNHK